MRHVWYEEINAKRRARKLTVFATSIAAAVVLTTAIGYATATAHGRRPTVGGDHTMNDDHIAASTATSSPVPTTTGVPAGLVPSDSKSATGPWSGRDRAGYEFRTIDDAKDPTFNQLLGINDRGRIVGYFGSGTDAAHPNKGFRILPPYRQGDFFDKNFPGSVQTQAVGVNNAAVVVGFYVDAAGANIGFVAHGQHYKPVANPAGSATPPFNQLLGINNHAIAVGFYNDATGTAHGYTYDTRSGELTPVELPKDTHAESVTATGIADNGDISGFYTVGKITSGFVIHHGTFRQLSFGAMTNTQALGVNNTGQVVGSYLDAAGTTHGFLWSPHSPLRSIDDPNSAGTTVINGLNNRGQLVGFYTDTVGNTHGLLATRHSASDDSTS
jgi:probable HAF family extracellular repeat protein